MTTRHFFDVRTLISDLGGAALVAAAMGICRTQPYRWIRKGFMSSTKMARLKDAFPGLALDDYFDVTEGTPNEQQSLGGP